MKVNISNLNTIVNAIASRLAPLAQKDASHQPAVDAVANAVNNADAALEAIVESPDPGPRKDLDFSGLDAAVEAFKSNQTISQSSVGGLVTLIGMNEPQ